MDMSWSILLLFREGRTIWDWGKDDTTGMLRLKHPYSLALIPETDYYLKSNDVDFHSTWWKEWEVSPCSTFWSSPSKAQEFGKSMLTLRSAISPNSLSPFTYTFLSAKPTVSILCNTHYMCVYINTHKWSKVWPAVQKYSFQQINLR